MCPINKAKCLPAKNAPEFCPKADSCNYCCYFTLTLSPLIFHSMFFVVNFNFLLYLKPTLSLHLSGGILTNADRATSPKQQTLSLSLYHSQFHSQCRHRNEPSGTMNINYFAHKAKALSIHHCSIGSLTAKRGKARKWDHELRECRSL